MYLFIHLSIYMENVFSSTNIDSSVLVNMLKKKLFFFFFFFYSWLFLVAQLLSMISDEITAFITSYTLHAQCNCKPM